MNKIKDCNTCQNEILKKIDKVAQKKCDDCLTVKCSPLSLDPTQYEPFEFNVGDYVELNDGSIGYIKQFDNFDDFYHVYINLSKGGTNFECHCKCIDFYKYFRRIGKYDFTEVKQPEVVKKIEHLEYSHTEKRNCTRVEINASDYPNSSPLKWVDELTDICVKTNTTDIIKKLNEVIDRVNEIGEKK